MGKCTWPPIKGSSSARHGCSRATSTASTGHHSNPARNRASSSTPGSVTTSSVRRPVPRPNRTEAAGCAVIDGRDARAPGVSSRRRGTARRHAPDELRRSRSSFTLGIIIEADFADYVERWGDRTQRGTVSTRWPRRTLGPDVPPRPHQAWKDSRDAIVASPVGALSNLWEPVPGNQAAHRRFGDRARRRSLQFWLTTHRADVALLVFATAATAWGGARRNRVRRRDLVAEDA
jgi:hypothetical protein